MMKKAVSILFIIQLLILLPLISCSNKEKEIPFGVVEVSAEEAFSGKISDETRQKLNDPKAKKRAKTARLYYAAFDALLSIDDYLNNGMQYIAVDVEAADNLTRDQKLLISSSLSEGPVTFRSYESLSEKNKVFEGLTKGVLLSVENIAILEKSVILRCSKYWSSGEAIGVKIKLEYRDNTWVVLDIYKIWED